MLLSGLVHSNLGVCDELGISQNQVLVRLIKYVSLQRSRLEFQ